MQNFTLGIDAFLFFLSPFSCAIEVNNFLAALPGLALEVIETPPNSTFFPSNCTTRKCLSDLPPYIIYIIIL